MSSQEEQREYQVSVEQAEAMVRTYEALLRLKKNPDFQLIIEQQYLTESVLDSVSLLAHEQMVKERPMIQEDLISASNLKNFLLRIERTGEKIKSDLDDLKQKQLEEEAEEALNG